MALAKASGFVSWTIASAIPICQKHLNPAAPALDLRRKDSCIWPNGQTDDKAPRSIGACLKQARLCARGCAALAQRLDACCRSGAAGSRIYVGTRLALDDALPRPHGCCGRSQGQGSGTPVARLCILG